MLISETAKILAKAQLLDNRTVDPETIKAWHEVIGRFEFADAMTALNLHRAESTEYLMPAHIKQNITRAKAMNKVNEARQRAIEISREREVLGEDATPTDIAHYRELQAQFGKSFMLPDNTKPAPTTSLSLYERMKNSPEAQGLDKSA